MALESIVKYMEGLVSDLEQKAHVALDTLTAKVNTANLQRVRNIKSQLNRLTTRVETLREVLEKYLDDDDDMKEMYLSKKILLQVFSGASIRSVPAARLRHMKLLMDRQVLLIRPLDWARATGS